MKAVILAGGLGTRISEESHLKPKPMIEIGGKPVLWHIMKSYSHYGINDFIICDVTFDMANNRMEVHQGNAEPWRVTLIDTGQDTLTGGRLKRVREHVGEETFCFTYGDGVADIDLQSLIDFHRAHGKHATVTAIQPPGRYGALDMDASVVRSFQEKPAGDGAWINGGFFVLEPTVFDYIEGDHMSWESQPLQQLASEGQLMAYQHGGFWQAMDTLRDKNHLEDLWNGSPPWKLWK